MSQAVELVRAVLAEPDLTPEQARALIDDALLMEADPLAYLARNFGLGETLVLERAAQWAGLAFFHKVPQALPELGVFDRLDALGSVRHIRGNVHGREVLFFAPTFQEMLALANHVRTNPAMRRKLCLVPLPALTEALADAGSVQLLDASRQRLARLWPFASAHLDLPLWTRLVFVVATLVIALIATLPLPLVFLPFACVLLLGPAVLRFWASFSPDPSQKRVYPLLDPSDLPVYSVLIPLRDEAAMVPMLVKAMQALAYPAEKLDIKFVVEAASVRTLAAVRAHLGDGPFELIPVPDALPRTKPKALNYALPFVRGEHVVIYDAEDIPAADQLWLAASHFAARPDIACLQAALVIDNADENALTGLFAAEYAGLFGVVLPAFARWRLPLPLGGTSNHFRVTALRDVGGWDAFNVTEDIDLGLRLARLGLACDTLASHTHEEAPVRLMAWLRQRTRWMKGWMQTFIVHNRHPLRLLGQLGWRGFLAFQIHTAGTILSPLLHTLLCMSVLARLTIPGWGWTLHLDPWSALQWAILVVGYAGALTVATCGLFRMGRGNLLPLLAFVPIYWVLHAWATLLALRQLVDRPYFWAKTEHGHTRLRRGPPIQKAAALINKSDYPYTNRQ